MLPNGYKLLSEADLAREFAVARGTVRTAIQTLVQEGLVEQVHGLGTFVTMRDKRPPADTGYGPLISTGERLIRQGIEFEDTLLGRTVLEGSHKYGPFMAHRSMQIRRLRRLLDGPASVTDTLLNLDVIPQIEHLSDEELCRGSLHATLRYRFGVRFDWAERFFSAESAPADAAELLELPAGSPVLCYEQLSYVNDSDCVEYSRSWTRTDKHRHVVTIKDAPR